MSLRTINVELVFKGFYSRYQLNLSSTTTSLCWFNLYKSCFTVKTNFLQCKILIALIFQITIRDQFDGWTNLKGGDAILCLCPRKAEGPLSKYFVLKGKRPCFLLCSFYILFGKKLVKTVLRNHQKVFFSFLATNQPKYNLLQLNPASRAFGQEDHWSGVFLLLYTCQDGSGSS